MIIKWCFYLALLGSVSILGLIRWRIFSVAEKILTVLLNITLLSELTSLYTSYRFRNDFVVYHIFTPVQFLLISLYFNYSIEAFRARRIGIWIGCAGLFISIANTVFLQKILTINSNFLLFEGTAVIIYCLLAFRQILLDEDRLPYGFALFWLTICFSIYWSSTFMGWGVYALLNQDDSLLVAIFDKVLTAVNFAFYSGIGVVFLTYKKLIPSTCA